MNWLRDIKILLFYFWMWLLENYKWHMWLILHFNNAALIKSFWLSSETLSYTRSSPWLPLPSSKPELFATGVLEVHSQAAAPTHCHALAPKPFLPWPSHDSFPNGSHIFSFPDYSPALPVQFNGREQPSLCTTGNGANVSAPLCASGFLFGAETLLLNLCYLPLIPWLW